MIHHILIIHSCHSTRHERHWNKYFVEKQRTMKHELRVDDLRQLYKSPSLIYNFILILCQDYNYHHDEMVEIPEEGEDEVRV